MADADLFRWQALLQRVAEPLFLLDRQRRILFVNRAWETLTGLARVAVRGKRCRRFQHAEAASWEAVAHLLAPPADVLKGNPTRVRRVVTRGAGRSWWDVEFFPLQGADGLLAILGKINVVGTAPPQLAPLSERLLALRETVADRYSRAARATTNLALSRVADQVHLASQTRAAVLIFGESGSGKEWTARAIHYRSADRDRPFAALDCKRLPAIALTEALFGAGSLMRPGGLGTLYLKEPAQLPRDVQARLCELLAAADSDRPRVISGSTTDAAIDMDQGRLLEAFHALLSTLVIALPPLRQCFDDLPGLVQQLLERLNADEEHRVIGLTPEAEKLLHAYRWPGNVRELQAVLVSARWRAKDECIGTADLPSYLRQGVQLDQTAGRPPERSLPLEALLEQVERRLIVLALRAARGNRSRAAKLLAISRPRLLRRMETLKIDER